MKNFKLTALAALFLLMGTPAYAHVGLAGHGGFLHGIAHPFSGVDHLLAMVAVGLFAFQLGGRALWLVPGAFVTMMVAGGILGFSGYSLPGIETGIALSVSILGGLIAGQVRMPVAAAMAVVGCFAIIHGHAHGAELPTGAHPAAFAAGFVIATLVLHLCGLGLGLLIGRTGGLTNLRLDRVAGGAIAAAGLALLA